METVTVYKDIYEELQSNEFRLMTELAQLKGAIDSIASSVQSESRAGREIGIEMLVKLSEEIKSK